MADFTETERLAALHQLAVLDTPADDSFDQIATAAAALCATPISAVSLVDAERQWFKARVGLEPSETSREVSFCAHAMLSDDIFVVPDATRDPLFADNPLVTGDASIRFYAGAPIRTPEGLPLGALCVIDRVPRPQGLSGQEAMMLRALANQVEVQLQLRSLLRDRESFADRQAIAIAAGMGREERLVRALDSAEVGWWDWHISEDRVTGSPELARIFGLDPVAAGRGQPLEAFFANIHPADRGLLRDAVQDCIETGAPFHEEYRIVQADGSVTWTLARGRCLRDAEDRPWRFPGVALDITGGKRAEEQIRDLDAGRELAMQAAGLGRFDHNPATGERFYDHRALDMMGLTESQAGTVDGMLSSVVHVADRERLRAAHFAAIHPERSGPMKETFRVRHGRSGEERWIAVTGRSLFKDGVCTRFMGVFEDVTASRRAEEHRRLLTNELNHRVKNSMAVVHGLVDQSLRNAAGDLNAVRNDIAGRIQALAHAHDLLTADNWSTASVHEIVAGLLRSLSLPKARLEIAGPPVALGPGPAMQLSLALHELATNAIKYGALSNDTGRVSLTWNLDDAGEAPAFVFDWSERGGPTVTAPTRRGFGSTLIERATARAFNGDVSLDYRPTGLQWTLRAPAAGLPESGRSQDTAPAQA